jgi:hypothetical protein
MYQYTDQDLTELCDCLLEHFDLATRVLMGRTRLTDETGVKLARYVAASSTVQTLSLYSNQVGDATYLALAAALKVNTSLRFLDLCGKQSEDKIRIETALVEALRLNPSRPVASVWRLYSYRNEFSRLKKEAEELGHPSLQSLLATHLVQFKLTA